MRTVTNCQWYHREERWVSLKVLTRDLSRGATDERDALETLKIIDPKHDGYNHVLALLDSFTQDGPYGQHMCLVYKAMGEPIGTFQARFAAQRFPTALMKRISKQLLLGLDYTHSCGLIHTGTLLNSIDTYA